ncbi:hypothetical protein DPX16_18786 [Anabarilius grahami]|uniref:Uncharacterized protein n=1 Tax=Anabarilius grahami TaxID=495550 RepID=A0A3N0Y226_ANAGA|nr:hypothetical protein DPX16_18786 [Anabarilius grahami]
MTEPIQNTIILAEDRLWGLRQNGCPLESPIGNTQGHTNSPQASSLHISLQWIHPFLSSCTSPSPQSSDKDGRQMALARDQSPEMALARDQSPEMALARDQSPEMALARSSPPSCCRPRHSVLTVTVSIYPGLHFVFTISLEEFFFLQFDAETVACRDGGVLSGNEPGGAGLQRASENQDNPAQKAGHTTTVQRSENQGETNREHDTRTACNELTKTT